MVNWLVISGIGMVLLVILLFNSLVRLRNNVKNSWSGIDVQLKRRSDLIPNLVETVKGYADHEKKLLTSITKARTSLMESSDKKNIAFQDNLLSDSLRSLFAVAENYPKLRADAHFLQLQSELSETEDQIAAARRIYNENVAYLNTKVESFPTNILAKIVGFRSEDYYGEGMGSGRKL